MYSIEEFKQELIPWLENFLKEQYGDAHITIEPTEKTNQVLTGINCIIHNNGPICTPILYLENLYQRYCQCGDYEETLDGVKNAVVSAIENISPYEDNVRNFYKDHNNVYFHFIHTEQNKALLETMPHREFYDMSIVYRCFVFRDETGTATAQINHRLANLMGLNEEELYQLAYENTRRLFPTSIKPIKEVIEELQGGASDELVEALAEAEAQEEPTFYVVTNQTRERGAVSILYTDELQKLAEKLECDLYLLPSSLHEMLAVPEKYVELDTLKDMVYEVNQLVVEVEDRLSNEVYKYDRNEQSIVQVTDTQHKMLVEEADGNMGMDMQQIDTDNVIFSLINTEKYHEKLKEIPHRQFEDLSIVYYERTPEEESYTLIHNADMKAVHLTEEELYQMAFENTRRITPPKVRSISEMMQELAEEMGVEVQNDYSQVPAYVITNEQRHIGAVNILYSDIMEEVSQKLGGDLWLIPGSTNEFIATKIRKDLSIENLQELVHFMNTISYPTRTRLSNQLYHYDSATGQIKQATSSPYTRLDEGRPQWSDWVLEGQELPRTNSDMMDENLDGMQMGM